MRWRRRMLLRQRRSAAARGFKVLVVDMDGRVVKQVSLAAIGSAIDRNLAVQRDCSGERAGEGWEGGIGSACPVQGTGTVDGHGWYFRARGASWSFEVIHAPEFDFGSDDEQPILWETGGDYGVWPQAGWMPYSDAWSLIQGAIARFRSEIAEK